MVVVVVARTDRGAFEIIAHFGDPSHGDGENNHGED